MKKNRNYILENMYDLFSNSILKYLIIFSLCLVADSWKGNINLCSLLKPRNEKEPTITRKKRINDCKLDLVDSRHIKTNMKSNNLKIKNPYDVEGMVFQGGGTRGIVYPGIIKYLEELKIMSEIKYLAGTSAGAIIASLVAFGYSSIEIENIIKTINWKEILNNDFKSSFTNLYQLTNKYGLYNSENIQNYLDKLFEEKCKIKDCTFIQLYNMTGIHLKIGVCCVSDENFTFFDYQCTPNMPISLGVRASSSIPLIFTTTSWNDQLYIDGGILGNLPIGSFPTKKCVAFELVSDYEKKKNLNVSKNPTNLFDYISVLVNMILNAAQAENGFINKYSENITIIKVNTHNIGLMDIKLSEKKINIMIAEGYKSISNYFNKFSINDN